MTNRSLSQEELDDAKRLRKLWGERKEQLHLSQVKAAKELGYNSQSAVSQFINGKVPINVQTAAKFAKLLKTNIEEISPRFGKLLTQPIPSSLDGFVAPTTGVLGGINTDACLAWFAWSEEFCASINVAPQHLKLVKLEDDSFKEYPAGTIFLVDDARQSSPVDGIYLLQQADKIIARRVTLGDDVVISSGKQKQHVSRDTFALLRILGKVVCVFSPVLKH
jgi:transcriptional regulator with XRE-family HTH domain